MAPSPNRSYFACLLRIWRDEPSGPWRVMIRNVHTETELLFPDLLAAFAFIEAHLEAAGPLDTTVLPGAGGEAAPERMPPE